MKLLFSGATNFKVPQTEANKSLGGFMSSSSVPNGKINALFSDISGYDLKEKNSNTIAIFFYNDGTTDINNLSLEMIYQNKLGVPVNYADFEFSITEMSATGSIELIGSIFEEPFYANWFTPESRYEDCRIELKTPGNVGDDFSIFGLIGTLTGDTLATFQKDILDLINSSPDLICQVVDEKTVYIRRNVILVTGENSEFLTSGFAEIVSDQNLANGLDGRTIIYPTLAPEKALGIWMKRKINDNYKSLTKECKTLEEQDKTLDKTELFELNFQYD